MLTLRSKRSWSSANGAAVACLLGFTIAACAESAAPADHAATEQAVAEARYQAAQAEQRAAAMKAEVEGVRRQLFKLEQYQAESRREQAKLLARIDHLLELGQRTLQATTAQKAAAPTVYGDDMPRLGARQLDQRALQRALDRLDLTTEQKRGLLQMMQPPRELDGTNPWNGEAEWH